MKVLIVETDLGIIDDVRLAISKYQPDWQLSVIEAGIKCLALIKEFNSPDLVIVGMRLSDMSGFELIEHIRDDSDLPVVILSRDKDINVLVKAFNSGAHDYIEAPFNKAVFIARIKAKLRRCIWDIRANKYKSTDISNNCVLCHSQFGEPAM